MAASIREKGVIQPIIVRPIGAGYEVVAGNRRLEAVKSLGLNKIAAIVKDLNDEESLTLAIVENLQRKNLNLIEEAEAFKRLMDEFDFSLENIAKFVGKDKSFVANALRLLKLPVKIKEAVRDNKITYTQARALIAIKEEGEQHRLFQELLQGKMSVRVLENKVRAVNKKRGSDPFITEMEEKLQRILGTKIKIVNKKNNHGKVIIEYYGLTDLDRLLRRLG